MIFSGCASPGTGSARPAVPLSGRVMIVSAINLADQGGPDVPATCPVSGRVVRSGPVADGAVKFMTDALITAMEKLPGVALLSPTQAQGAISRVIALPGSDTSDVRIWSHAGRILAAEHFAVISMYRFKERVGRNYGVETPASVGFGLHLVAVGDGTVVWSGWYDETQEPLNRNLLQLGTFISRKGQWITARDMAKRAVSDMVDKMTPQ